jgi:hypothetical protein
LSSDRDNPDTGQAVTALTAKFQTKSPAVIATTDGGTGSSGVNHSAARAANPRDQFTWDFGNPRQQWEASESGLKVKIGAEAFHANVHLGSQNDDGSQGENIGAMATLAGVDVTAEYGGWSLTADLSSSVGASVSSGEGRDSDNDGKAERCFSVSFGPVTLGECDEL